MSPPHPTDTALPRFISVEQTCQVLGIGRTKLNELLKAKTLPSRKLARRTLIDTRDLERFIESLPYRS